jgi:simple sugar transport system ATP-binding protein
MTEMTATAPAATNSRADAPLIEARSVTKFFGSVIALYDVSLHVRTGEVLCLLGDNGAGKSTLIKTLSGVHPPDKGEMLVEGQEVTFSSPRDALQAGIATVYQDLAMIPLLSISRNFFLGSEPTLGFGPFKSLDMRVMDRTTRDALRGMGIDLRDTSQPVGTLSGGERQSVAIARAIHFGAKVVILDEPTSALGVKEAAVVLRFIGKASDHGIGVILITHNINHAYPVGDRFTILDRGRMRGTFNKADLTPAELLEHMGGGAELDELRHELEQAGEPAAPLLEAQASETEASGTGSSAD